MAKQKKIQEPGLETPETIPAPVIEPISITKTDAPQSQAVDVIVPAGHVLLVALDADGNEKAGSEFFYSEKSYKRFYGDETKFRVKKKLK